MQGSKLTVGTHKFLYIQTQQISYQAIRIHQDWNQETSTVLIICLKTVQSKRAILKYCIKNLKKTLLPLFIDGVQLPQDHRTTARKQLTFYC